MSVRTLGLFAGVGVVNTLLSLAVIQASLSLGAGDYRANLLGYLAGFACSYLLNSRVTFASARKDRARIMRFALAAGLSYLVNLAVLGLARRAGLEGSLLAQVPAMAAYTATFYLLSRHVVFRD